MDKKGFTLVELIGVIALLAVIILISVPIVNSSIENAKQRSYEEQVHTIVENAKKWVVTYGPKTDADFTITLAELIEAGLLENDVIMDPRDDTNLLTKGACIFVSYVTSSKSYNYKFSDECSNN